ncbi:MAG: molybdopterin-dependent oxidoreductase [Acidobacteria bacterium]|nr:molybdopterin-dependent oxidoreductase [Acidobacteriota bacterium]
MNQIESNKQWQPTACILCSRNCGIEVETNKQEIVKVRGDKAHPISTGYLCQKAQRLNFYQNHNDRLNSPLRRCSDGTFEKISWDTAITEIAAKLVNLRDTYGGHSLAYYGGGGQGNHLAGPYAKALRLAMNTSNYYNSLAQEKTGGFWVDGRLYGRQNCHPTEDVEHAEVVVFIGTNPWQSHGIRNARQILQEIHKDPNRKMIVIDPRRTETAAMADLHLQLRPGTDAFLMAAILAVIVQENRHNQGFLEKYTTGFNVVYNSLISVPIKDFAIKAGIELKDVYEAAHLISEAKSCSVRTDLGIEQTLNSTLNAYLRSLLFLITGNFGKKGANNFHTALVPMIGHSDEGKKQMRSKVTEFPFIANLLPPNILPLEIDTDHPDRTRGLVVDSSNPIVSAADTQAYRKAFAKLDLLVVIDVAMTETAAMAHYILPASSQYEKWETTFFNMEFPKNAFHLRKPLFNPLSGTLAEPEIYTRLIKAMGVFEADLSELREVAHQDRFSYAVAFQQTLAKYPKLFDYAPIVLYQTLGDTLPEGAAATAYLWATCHQFAGKDPDSVHRAGHQGEGFELGEALFNAILSSHSGVVFSINEYEDTWKFIKHRDGLIHLEIPEMLKALSLLDPTETNLMQDYPFVLSAGERRSYNANTIFRDPAWRRSDFDGVLRINPVDATGLGLSNNSWVKCQSKRGSVLARVEVSDTNRQGVVTLPHGYGLEHPASDGKRSQTGPHINELTTSNDMDPIAGTPYHKYIPVRLIKIHGEEL